MRTSRIGWVFPNFSISYQVPNCSHGLKNVHFLLHLVFGLLQDVLYHFLSKLTFFGPATLYRVAKFWKYYLQLDSGYFKCDLRGILIWNILIKGGLLKTLNRPLPVPKESTGSKVVPLLQPFSINLNCFGQNFNIVESLWIVLNKVKNPHKILQHQQDFGKY